MPADRRSWIRGIPMAWRRLAEVARAGACAQACAGLWRHGGGGRRVVDIRPAPHALLGENGAGKSTIVKLLSGWSSPARDGWVHGSPARLAARAHALGIQTAFQEMTLVPDLSVLDNMLLMRRKDRWA